MSGWGRRMRIVPFSPGFNPIPVLMVRVPDSTAEA